MCGLIDAYTDSAGKYFNNLCSCLRNPSINPTVNALAPNVVTKKTGNKLCISSDDKSINRLTKPSAQMVGGVGVVDFFSIVFK
ncbi:hypothetical protein AU255_03915 [Methyloprofundus sedimenti]|uniref:Uncharacterized protein n=1 Tax=Methyloprofundus sedimenti TaxID=1420851 RepID=A0A1V8M652_9GAMM|nr:hypothetical protein AU255_03915 [Methyloprofundus sedimenti]